MAESGVRQWCVGVIAATTVVGVLGSLAVAPAAGADGAPGTARPTPVRRSAASFEPRTDELQARQDVGRGIETVGVVRQVAVDEQGLALTVGVRNSDIDVLVSDAAGLTPEALVDAEVRVRGVGDAVASERGQVTGMRLAVADARGVGIVREAPAASSLQVRRIDSLSDVATRDNPHRVRLHATVTLSRPGLSIFLRDSSGSLYAKTAQEGPDPARDPRQYSSYQCPVVGLRPTPVACGR